MSECPGSSKSFFGDDPGVISGMGEIRSVGTSMFHADVTRVEGVIYALCFQGGRGNASDKFQPFLSLKIMRNRGPDLEML